MRPPTPPDEVVALWDLRKAEEKPHRHESVLDGIWHLPAPSADKLIGRANKVSLVVADAAAGFGCPTWRVGCLTSSTSAPC
jgi:hypothetical protein